MATAWLSAEVVASLCFTEWQLGHSANSPCSVMVLVASSTFHLRVSSQAAAD